VWFALQDKVISLLQSGIIVIANVDDGQHFVLMTGYDTVSGCCCVVNGSATITIRN